MEQKTHPSMLRNRFFFRYSMAHILASIYSNNCACFCVTACFGGQLCVPNVVHHFTQFHFLQQRIIARFRTSDRN